LGVILIHLVFPYGFFENKTLIFQGFEHFLVAFAKGFPYGKSLFLRSFREKWILFLFLNNTLKLLKPLVILGFP